MVALATAFVRIRPSADRNEFIREGQKAADLYGQAAGKRAAKAFGQNMNAGLKAAERQSRASGERTGAALATGIGQKLNRQLRDLNLPELNLKADAASANRSITVTQEHLRELAKNAGSLQMRIDASNALRDINRLGKQVSVMSTETERSGRKLS